ncbi:VOC family protein [Rhodococcus sp. BP-149]|uniref:VOC family protein n=1 Tax=unclassified Rhodococcus (in: high G+C Gram-positive bacteria) TaxID=192944 RepID=UPI001C9AF366|nr:MULTISPECIES: VOC family protein [unclassified Rhodococcus (in: high G+C Gram-positive bacteria)]MBY6685045.1 VOC family protein [Rhodococcus sp. BP-288]MBY6692471.1 VOC family protein [Rhodococcus sp. BP-188]MBY6698369.1 VOC family protein [Rhodococcus sp. BP-285]MBY6701048.1 VOC family protein [Rhodococcus sp. BP-283]MBY6705945.1 VOC family protein [Rhodococcus sp. BP-241]
MTATHPLTMEIQLVMLPVTDVDRAKEFYTRIGFHADHDATPFPDVRYVQLTPPGSACSIAIGKNITTAVPGSVEGMLVVVQDAEAAREMLLAAGVEATPVKDEGWGLFTYFADPDGNRWSVQQLPVG